MTDQEQAPEAVFRSRGGEVSLRNLHRDQPVVLAFVAEAATPLCTSILKLLADSYEDIASLGATIIGVSSEPEETLWRAVDRHNLPFPLMHDPDMEATRSFAVADEPAGRSIRSIFVIDTNGRILHANRWFNPSNVDQLLAVIESLNTSQS